MTSSAATSKKSPPSPRRKKVTLVLNPKDVHARHLDDVPAGAADEVLDSLSVYSTLHAARCVKAE